MVKKKLITMLPDSFRINHTHLQTLKAKETALQVTSYTYPRMSYNSTKLMDRESLRKELTRQILEDPEATHEQKLGVLGLNRDSLCKIPEEPEIGDNWGDDTDTEDEEEETLEVEIKTKVAETTKLMNQAVSEGRFQSTDGEQTLR